MPSGVRRTNDTRCVYDFHGSGGVGAGEDRSTSKSGRFFSPLYPQHYPPHASCQFFFSAPPLHSVKVTFDVVDLEVTAGRSPAVTHGPCDRLPALSL